MTFEIDKSPTKLNKHLFKKSDYYENSIKNFMDINVIEPEKFIKSSQQLSNPVVQFIKMVFQSYKNLFLKNKDEKKIVAQYMQDVKADIQTQADEKEQKETREQELFELKNQLIAEVSDMISKQDTQRLNLILKKGYELTNEQTLQIIFKENIFDSEVVKKAIDYNLKTTFVHRIIEEFNSFESFYTQTHRYFASDNFQRAQIRIGEHFLKSKNILELFRSRVDIYEVLENDEIALSFLQAAKQLKYDMKDRSFSSKSEIDTEVDELIDYIETHKADLIEEAFDQEMSKYEDVLNEFNSIKKNLGASIIDNIKKFSEKDLPREAQEIIKNIKSFYKDISLDTLPIEHKLDVELLYNKRFPQVIEEYILISPRYKEKLISHNESPDKLLLESLTELSDKLKYIVDNAEENKHNKMRVTRQYLKNK